MKQYKAGVSQSSLEECAQYLGGGGACTSICCCSVAKSCPTLQFHELQHGRLSCCSLSPEVCSNLCPLSCDAIQPSHLLSPASLVFSSSELALCIRWPKYWSLSFQHQSFQWYSELISFKIDWFDLFAVKGALKSLPQHHNLKASILWRSAFFMVQLSHLYMTTGKIIALTV